MTDSRFMAMAIELAYRGLYTTHPNPRVGCVLVNNGVIVGSGWHQIAGQAHAEINALQQAGEQARGATAYVSLEPCSHYGKTPPCADALIKAGVARVVSAIEDPNPAVSGRGHCKLEAAGIAVHSGVLAPQAVQVNPGFIKRMQTGLPWVWLKSAMSIDGRTAMASGESYWITGTAARQDVQRLRARVEAIITGVDTLLHDDPSLTVRPADWLESEADQCWPADFSPIQPLRIVLDSRLRTPPSAKMLSLPGQTWIVAAQPDAAKQQQLEAAGAKVLYFPTQTNAKNDGLQVDLQALLRHLGQADINEVLIESGAVTAGAFVKQQLVDEWWLYMAPVLMGSAARPLLQLGIDKMQDKLPLHLQDVRHVGTDLRMRYQFDHTYSFSSLSGED